MATYNGTSGADTLVGGDGYDTIEGKAGDDSLVGNGANDLLAGNAGADTLDGGDGDDRLYAGDIWLYLGFPYPSNPSQPFDVPILDTGSERDVLIGGAGDDRIYAGYGDVVDGGSHASRGDILLISFLGAPAGVTVDFRQATQTIGGATISGIEIVDWVQGSAFADDITLNNQSGRSGDGYAMIFGGRGNDRLVAGYYTGFIFGEEDDDVIDGRPSLYLSSIDGGSGNDTLYPRDSSSAYGGTGNDTIYGGAFAHGGDGNDRIVLESQAYLYFASGDAGDDFITRSDPHPSSLYSHATIAGGDGADTIIGSSGRDILVSGNSGPIVGSIQPDMGIEHDVLSGGGYNDVIYGGFGDDLDGGEGDGDRLHLSLGGASSGITLDLGRLISGEAYMLGGGVIRNFEQVEEVLGTAFADSITAVEQVRTVTIDGAGGDDRITAGGSSAALYGGAGVDTLIGGVAGDTLDGGAGADNMVGGGGDDLFVVDHRDDRVSEANGGGNDKVIASVTWTLAAGQEIESIEAAQTDGRVPLNLTGNALGNMITGNFSANILMGMAGSDTLVGGGGDDTLDGGQGNDRLIGGYGHDVFLVDSTSDVVIEDYVSGTDMVIATVDYVLGDHVENLILIGGASSGTGNISNNRIIGNAHANRLSGEDGDDVLDGGAGADTMIGGAGNDVFFVDDIGDRVIEEANGGGDEIVTSISWSLADFPEIEALRANGPAALELTGNNGQNFLWGNEIGNRIHGLGGNDVVYGRGGDDVVDGGSGDDALEGEDGHDILNGGEGSDVLVGGGGNDRLYGQSVNGGIDAGDRLSGEGGSDYLQGNAGNDTLDGGDGSDRINGGADHDRITGGNGNDTVNGNLGNDSIDGGAGHDSLRGGQGNDSITGGDGNDILMGDLGVDTLTGGAGIDMFAFGGGSARFAGAAPDLITDFQAGIDRLSVGHRVDAVLVGGVQTSFAAATVQAQQLFDGRSGANEVAIVRVGTDSYLFYASGNGTTVDSAVQLAEVDARTLSVADFF